MPAYLPRWTIESSLFYSTSRLIFPEVFSSLAEILNDIDINYIIVRLLPCFFTFKIIG
jgi:hypothetical protein